MNTLKSEKDILDNDWVKIPIKNQGINGKNSVHKCSFIMIIFEKAITEGIAPWLQQLMQVIDRGHRIEPYHGVLSV